MGDFNYVTEIINFSVDGLSAVSVIRTVRNLDDANKLAQAIVNTIPEPFLVLDADLRVLEASRSFYEIFQVEPAQTQDCLLYDLGHGQWDIPALRVLLETILPKQVAMDGFEVDHEFPGIGHRIMLLNARKVLYDESDTMAILLAFRDITARRAISSTKLICSAPRKRDSSPASARCTRSDSW